MDALHAAKVKQTVYSAVKSFYHAARRATMATTLAALITVPVLAAEKPESHPPIDTNGIIVNDESANEETADIDLLEMEIPIVVTASRREQKITTVPYAVSVITADDIRHSGARSIPDALRLATGIDVADLSFGNAAVSPRGYHALTARYALILVDGRQIYDVLFGGLLWGTGPFQLDDIERIEVIRGPGGVTWGANAINGVINIITKDPADQLGLTVTGGGGSYGTHKEHLGYGFQDEKLRLRVSGEYEASDGFREGGSFLRKLEDDYKGGRMGLHAIYEASPNDTLTISGGSALVDGGLPPPPLARFDPRRNSGSQTNYLMTTWTHKIANDNQFEVTTYVNDSQVSNGMPAIDYRFQNIALQLRHTFKPTEDHTIIWGFDNRLDLLDATNSDPFALSKDFISTGVIGLYVQDQWQFAPKWTLDLGGRIDYECYGGWQPSARVSLSRELTENALVYGAISRAFQMPPVGLRFANIPMMNGLGYFTGHRSLPTYTMLAYEFGYRSTFFDRLETNLNLYWHEGKDILTVSPALGPPGLLRLDIDDRANASVYGVEADARFPVTDKLMLLGNYTFQILDWRSSVPFLDTDTLSLPKHKFMLGARYSPTEDLHLSSHLYFVDAVKAHNAWNPFIPRRIDPYFRLDLRAEYELWNDQASIAVGARNLLDPGHYEGGTILLNDAEVPRMVYAEFRMTIK